jgi:indole-3-glycerol phosphate synthase
MAETVLDRIVAAARRRMFEVPAPPDLTERAFEAVAQRRRTGVRSLRRSLAEAGPRLLAECKHASPSAGVLRDPFDPVALARAYERAGAAAISVVVEPEFFLGNPGWIPAVRGAVDLPVLRKDFIVSERQLLETALLGADAVLLIQRLLEPELTSQLLRTAAELEIEVLLEIFVDEDPAPAVASGAAILGVNARDLATFETRLDMVAELVDRLPADRVRVAESGIHRPEDVRRLADLGYDAFLVGEHLVQSDNPEDAARRLMAWED